MRVSVFGLGYVGCVSAACLARAGHEVTGVDLSPDKVALVNASSPPIVEPGLGDLLAEVVGQGRLRATTDPGEGVRLSDVALICVGTPGKSGGRLDVEAVERVARQIGLALKGRRDPYTVVLRSTVLPGTTRRVLLPALLSETTAESGLRLNVAVNPEFMREGSSLRDFLRPPFTLVGCDDQGIEFLFRSLYAGVEAPFVLTSVRAAETVKYVCNTFHALKVSFANEIGDVCEALDVDAGEVMRIFLMDRKLNVSEAYLRPGFAFGGSCLPKDLRALLHAAREADLSLPLLSAILPSNEAVVRRAVESVLKTRRRRIGLVGLSFKPGTDDLRESPIVALAEALIGKGCEVRILDRRVSVARLTGANRRFIRDEIPHIASLMCGSASALLAHAEVIVVARPGEEATSVLADVRPDQTVIDLTRGGAQALAPARQEAGTP
jgi:GDP-mannose 6-dehydrogenase